MVIACLPSETTYDVQCPVCGRGFLFLTDAAEADRAALRRSATAALAAQHNKLKGRSDRRSADRRKGHPDARMVKLERRQAEAMPDRRDPECNRRGAKSEPRGSDQERRTASPAFRRGSGIAHPREVFYLQGWDGPTERDSRSWAQHTPFQPGALC